MFNQPECAGTRFMQQIPLEPDASAFRADILNTQCFCEHGAVQLTPADGVSVGPLFGTSWRFPARS